MKSTKIHAIVLDYESGKTVIVPFDTTDEDIIQETLQDMFGKLSSMEYMLVKKVSIEWRAP